MAPFRFRFIPAFTERHAHMPERSGNYEDVDHHNTPHRLGGLADGVFAIAMTLLVIELGIPEHLSAAGMREALWDLSPKLVLYAMSFLVLGAYWGIQSSTMHYIVRVDHGFVVWQTLFLLAAGLVPFSTSFLGHYPLDSLAIQFYAANLAMCGVFFAGSLLHARANPILVAPMFDRRVFRAVWLLQMVPPVFYVFAIVLAFVSPPVALGILVVMPLVSFFPNPVVKAVLQRIAGWGVTHEEAPVEAEAAPPAK